jgi:hypothetical protein
MKTIQKGSRYIAIIIGLIIIIWVFVLNSVPFTFTRSYTSNNKDILAINPVNRTKIIGINTDQIDDLVYFSSNMPINFDSAKVKVKFKNPSNNQQLLLGYKDEDSWHYNTQVLDAPFINNLKWNKIGSGPYLYQKEKTYKSIKDFLSSPPINKVVGSYDYKDTESLQPTITIPNYKPSKINTIINTPLRGKVTMYTYLENEPFEVNITKQDLNWYADPDAAKISVYKGNDKVFSATIDDDDNSSINHKIGLPQTINIHNPGPGLPESGVYKIVIDITNDSIIKSISTNLHKMVFEGPIYVAENHEIYGAAVKSTSSTSLTTNAKNISLTSEHNQSSKVAVGPKIINITEPNKVYTVENNLPLAQITIPRSDMIVNGSGYFSISPEQYFAPSPYRILPIENREDISQADYILTNYPGKPIVEDGWKVAQRNYSINDAFIDKKHRLSWILRAPNLKENNNKITYHQINMSLSKKGWLKE